MAWIIKFIPLSDAYYFLNQVKGLPATASSYELRSRFVRSCILLAWVALEGAVAYELKKLTDSNQQIAVPAKLGNKLAFLMRKKEIDFDMKAFKLHRQLRNRIAHPASSQVYFSPPFEIAQQTFDYCVGLMKVFYSSHLEF